MDARGNIYYSSFSEEIPTEDVARLEGYLLATDDRREHEERGYETPAARRRRIEANRLRIADDARRRYQRRHP